MRHYNATEIKKLIRIRHEQLYFNKFVNLQEIPRNVHANETES